MASLYQRGEMWWAKYRQGGRIIRTSTGCTTKRAARDWLDVRAGKVASGERVPVKLDKILYDELHQDLLTFYQTVKPIRSLVHQKYRMERVLAHFRGWRAANVTATDNGKLMQVPKITLLAEAAPRSGFVEQPAFDAIAAHLEAAQRLAATIAFEVAWRCKSEVLTLMWNKVDLDEGRIYLDEAHSKNGKARHAYLSPSTISMLRAQRARVETLQQEIGRIIPDVFVHLEKGRWQGQRIFKFDDAWRTACRKAGYPGVLIHDLRRSGVRALVRSGTPESVAMRISGHETRSIFDRYNITSDQNLRDARDRRTQFGHNEGGKVVSIAR